MIAALVLALATGAVGEAERLAAAAVQEGATAKARRALTLTADFDPTAFVSAGRKGEVVEDAYVAAREEYRRHRARLFEAVGKCLAREGQHQPAVRYLRRAVALAEEPERSLALAGALLALGQGWAALDALEKWGPLSPEGLALVERAADVAALPSAQVEIDRWRLTASGVEFRDGPFAFPEGVRLSTTPVFRLEDAPVNAFYAAEVSCRSCSEDLQTLRRLLGQKVRVLTVPEKPDQDHALRQVLGLYRSEWPIVLGKGAFEALKAEPRQLLLVGRSGWAGALLKPPFGPAVPAAVSALEKADVRESIPRAGWNHRAVLRRPATPPPALLPEGLAPGEDAPFPAEFPSAVEAYRSHRFAEALRLFEALEAKGDGWLLPPEARLNRGLCLAGLGRRDEARRLILRTGDSRFQDAVDRALETVASPPRRTPSPKH